jgi:hypothetical protein
MQEMCNRVGRITEDLNILLRELEAAPAEGILTPEVIKAFKSSVDAMRRLLWVYTSSSIAGQSRNPTLRGIVNALENMGEIASPASAMPAGGSFIEKVEAIVERKISGGRSH